MLDSTIHSYKERQFNYRMSWLSTKKYCQVLSSTLSEMCAIGCIFLRKFVFCKQEIEMVPSAETKKSILATCIVSPVKTFSLLGLPFSPALTLFANTSQILQVTFLYRSSATSIYFLHNTRNLENFGNVHRQTQLCQILRSSVEDACISCLALNSTYTHLLKKQLPSRR